MSDGQTVSNPAREVIAKSPMHWLQWVVVALCCLINMSEGYDVLSLGLAAPQLTTEWSVSPQILGLTFSATSVGLALGAFFVAPVADRVGRRAVILMAVAIITVVHWVSAVAGNIWMILVLRFIMGLGFGVELTEPPHEDCESNWAPPSRCSTGKLLLPNSSSERRRTRSTFAMVDSLLSCGAAGPSWTGGGRSMVVMSRAFAAGSRPALCYDASSDHARLSSQT